MNDVKKWLTSATLLLMSVSLSGCFLDDDDDDVDFGEASQTVETAELRVLHGSPDAPNVDVTVDGDVVLSNVSYQAGSPFLRVPEGERTIELLVAGTDTVALTTQVDLEAGEAYTAIAANEVADLELLVIEEDQSSVPAGEIRVNAVHAAAEVSAVNLYVTGLDAELGTPTLTDVPYTANAEIGGVPGGSYRVRATLASDTDNVVVYDSGTLELPVGTDYTLVAVPSTKGASPISLVALTGNAGAPSIVILDDSAEVRVVHASSDTPPVDVYANGGLVLQNVAFKGSSDYLKVPSGDYEFAVTLADDVVENAALEIPATLERGESYTVLAIGSLDADTLDSWLVPVDRTSLDDARIQVLHAVPNTPVDVYLGGPSQEVATSEPFAADLQYNTVLGPTELAPSEYRVQVTPAGNKQTVAIDAALTLSSGNIFTAVAVADDGVFDLLLLDDQR